MMPIAHLHSIVRSSLPVILAGGKAIWAPGFDKSTAPSWIDTLRPTWISAVPAVHRGLLEMAVEGWRPPQVRRIGVGSDRIETDEIARLRDTFEARVIVFYGMTETTPYVAMTPASGPAGPQGSVGRVNDVWDVQITREDGGTASAGEVGEIAVSGSIINPTLAQDGSFRVRLDKSGRLRTGDLGRLDADGFLFLEGRVDEMINRGGEKIPPAAVETALVSHKSVQRAVAFPLPDSKLGARVAAVVELADGEIAEASSLLDHASKVLPYAFQPERIFFASNIPTSGEANKVSRRALSEMFSNAESHAASSRSGGETNQLTERVRQIFARRLSNDRLGPQDDFFESGGDSLMGLEVLIEIEDVFAVSLSPAGFSQRPTATAVAEFLESSPPETGRTRLDIMRECDDAPPLLYAYGVSGNVGFARNLSTELGDAEGFGAFHARDFDPDATATRDMRSLAVDCARVAERVQPSGPFCLAGFSFGAHLALATAQELVSRGRDVAFLGVIDDEADIHKRLFGVDARPPRARSLQAFNKWALDRTPASFYSGRITYFPAAENAAELFEDPTAGWGEIALGGVEIIEVEGSHHSFQMADGLKRLAPVLSAAKAAALAGSSTWARSTSKLDNARAQRYAARAAGRAGKLEEEIAALIEATSASDEAAPWLYRQLAYALMDAERKEESSAAMRAAVRCSSWPLLSYRELMPLIKSLNDNALQASALEAALAEKARHPSAELVRAQVFFALNRTELAMSALRKALSISPKHLKLRLRLAEFCVQCANDSEAAAILTEVARDYPSVDFIWLRLGRAQLRIGDLENSVRSLRRSLDLREDNPRAWRLLARAFKRLGRSEQALSAKERADRLTSA